MHDQAEKIKKYLLRYIPKYPHNIVRRTMEYFNVSRTTVLRHLKYLINNNQVLKSGLTKQVTYYLRDGQKVEFCHSINSALEEHAIFILQCK